VGIHARTGRVHESITAEDVQQALGFLESALASLPDIRPEWMALAECRGVDTAIFFPRRGELTDAFEYCERCVVADQCSQFALSFDVRTPGIWGGESEGRRRQRHAAQLASTRARS
jgi:hypothetical protein